MEEELANCNGTPKMVLKGLGSNNTDMKMRQILLSL